MSFPEYVPTRDVTVGGAMVLESSDLLTISATLKASRSLIWADTGYRFESMKLVEKGAPGSEILMPLPRTDVQGWKDPRSNQLIDVSVPGSYSHRYTIDIEFLDAAGAGLGLPTYTIGPFVVPGGEGPIDLDKILPVGTVSGDTVSVPDSWSAAVAAANAVVVASAAQVQAAEDAAEEAVAAVAGKQSKATLSTDLATKLATPADPFTVAVGAKMQTGVTEPGDIRDGVDGRVKTIGAPLVGTEAPRVRPTVRNRAKLARFETALATKACPVITVLGNSITWGVGSDGSGSTTTGFVESYRQNAWPVQLRKLLARNSGRLPAENFVGLAGVFGYSTNLAGGAAPSGSVGPFGYLVSGGGMTLPSTSASMDIAAAKLGPFTELDVLYWGTGSGVGGGFAPKVLIDDVEVYAGGTASSGNLSVATITGLADSPHKITLKGMGTNQCFVAGVVPRRSSGVVVNRVATPGSRAGDVSGASAGFTTVQQQRNIDAAICAGYSDLVIVQFTANEVYQQDALANFQSAVEGIVSRAVAAGACVLLTADPDIGDATAATLPIKGSQYRAVLQAISDASTHVAYADQNAVFGNRTTAEALGLFPSATVHPALEGHRRMADFILSDVLPGAAIPQTSTAPLVDARTAALSDANIATPAGQWVLPPNHAVAASSAALGNGNCRAFPIVLRRPTKIDALSASITVAGSAGSLMRLGVYADDGTGYPGALVVDAGTVAADANANPIATFTAVTLQPGVYWLCGTLQGAPATQPTFITPSVPTPPIPIRVGTSPTAGTAFGFIQASVTGALPTTFGTALSTTGAVPRVSYRVA